VKSAATFTTTLREDALARTIRCILQQKHVSE
jgi:hypothetical protein